MRPLLFVLLVAARPAAAQVPRLDREERPPVVVPGAVSSQAVWLDDSTLALADTEEQRVMLVDLRSGRIRTAGRPGEGPGEYRGVVPPLRGPEGSLLVLDSRLRRATILNQALQVQRTVILPVVVSAPLQWTGAELLGTWYDFTRQMTPVLGHLRLTAGERAEPVPRLRLDSLFGVTRSEAFTLPPIVAAALGARGRIYLGRLDQYRILRLNASGRIDARFARPEVPALRFTAREIEEQTGRLRAASGAPVPAAAAGKVKDMLAGMVKPYFAMTGLSEDIQGRLWVVTARSDGRSTEVDVFAPSGRFLGTVSLRGQVRSLAWRGTRVAAVVERAEGEEALGAVDFYRVR
jgi:hypothetical protein